MNQNHGKRGVAHEGFLFQGVVDKGKIHVLAKAFSLFILEFVAMGREGSPSSNRLGEETDDDNFPDLPLARDWRARGDRLAKPSSEGDFG
jgi:hypothetical protein